MLCEIKPSPCAIGDYLKLKENTIFIVPEYQRPYSWQIENCDKLWQDITDNISNGNEDKYFLGTIIICCENNDTEFTIIDGQQRTTTFLLLLKALLLRINEVIKNTVGKTKQDEDSEDLLNGLQARRRVIMSILCKVDSDKIHNPHPEKDKLLFNNKSVLRNKSINEHHKNDLNAILCSLDIDEAESRVDRIPRRQKDNKYSNYFRNFKFFCEKVSYLQELQLNTFAKTLIEKCEVIEIKSWQVEQAIKMFNSLNSDGLPLYDSDIISAQLYQIAEGKNEKNEFMELWEELKRNLDGLKQKRIANIDEILMQQMFYEHAKNEKDEVRMTGLRRFFTDEKRCLLKEPLELCNQLNNLAKIWEKVSVYPIMQVLLKFSDNAKRFIASYFHRFDVDEIKGEEDIKVIATCLLRLFTLLELVDTGYSSSNFKIFLFEEIVKMADPNIPVQTIKANFDIHISKNWKKDDIKTYVMEYQKNILVYLNEYLFAQEHGKKYDLRRKYDIEHIMPQSGSNRDAIRKDAGIDDLDEFKNLVTQLGNKILLEEKINRSLGNDWFRTKLTKYKESELDLMVHALVEKNVNIEKPSWGKTDIENATKEACDRIVKFIFGE